MAGSKCSSYPTEGMQSRGMDGSGSESALPRAYTDVPTQGCSSETLSQTSRGKKQSAFYTKRKEKFECSSLLLKFYLYRKNSNKCFGVFVREWSLGLSILLI